MAMVNLRWKTPSLTAVFWYLIDRHVFARQNRWNSSESHDAIGLICIIHCKTSDLIGWQQKMRPVNASTAWFGWKPIGKQMKTETQKWDWLLKHYWVRALWLWAAWRHGTAGWLGGRVATSMMTSNPCLITAMAWCWEQAQFWPMVPSITIISTVLRPPLCCISKIKSMWLWFRVRTMGWITPSQRPCVLICKNTAYPPPKSSWTRAARAP